MLSTRNVREERGRRDWRECLLSLSGSCRLSRLLGSVAPDKQALPKGPDKPGKQGARPVFLACLALLAAALAGCGVSPTVRFYTLSSVAAPVSGDAAPDSAAQPASPSVDPSASPSVGPSVGLGPITLPDVVDRPQFVLQTGPNRVMIADEHRWAEPLKSLIPRVIADNLSRILGVKQVWSYPQHAAEKAEFRVSVNIQRFESSPGEAAVVDASWTVRRGEGEPIAGRSLAKEAVDGSGYDALAAAHSRALATVSREIAKTIPPDLAPQP